MIYFDQWKALSSHIRGITGAGKLHAEFLKVRSSDGYGRGKRLAEQIKRFLIVLDSFLTDFRQSLPPAAMVTIEEFKKRNQPLIEDTSGGQDSQQGRLWAVLVNITGFEAEMSFLLSDEQETIRVRSERAFSHLQRLIVVDADARNKWMQAFEVGEVACEKLGAAHLLWHGIWAFKVNAAGGRTDLVFQEPINLADARRSADGFVLTEWKKSNTGTDAEKLFGEAREQANRYAQGVLAGSELTSYRYAVIVSHRQVAAPDDIRIENVVYRHINIAVEPLTPSRG
jgi:hypothetical protein